MVLAGRLGRWGVVFTLLEAFWVVSATLPHDYRKRLIIFTLIIRRVWGIGRSRSRSLHNRHLDNRQGLADGRIPILDFA